MFSYFFFFKQKTAYELRISDWSSDVCSSDLRLRAGRPRRGRGGGRIRPRPARPVAPPDRRSGQGQRWRSCPNRLIVRPNPQPPTPRPSHTASPSSPPGEARSEEYTSELTSLMRLS